MSASYNKASFHGRSWLGLFRKMGYENLDGLLFEPTYCYVQQKEKKEKLGLVHKKAKRKGVIILHSTQEKRAKLTNQDA